MGQRAPKRFLVILAVGLVISYAFSWWMESRHEEWLAAHPIHVNLISGVVGFCGGFLTLAIVYNWFVDWDRTEQIRKQLLEKWEQLFVEASEPFTFNFGNDIPRIQNWPRSARAFVIEFPFENTEQVLRLIDETTAGMDGLFGRTREEVPPGVFLGR